jgi:hypothetical protein
MDRQRCPLHLTKEECEQSGHGYAGDTLQLPDHVLVTISRAQTVEVRVFGPYTETEALARHQRVTAMYAPDGVHAIVRPLEQQP